MPIDTFWGVLEWVGSLGFMMCLVPQFIRTLRRRTADDLSIPFLLLVIGASCVTLPVMLHSRLYVFAVSQGFNIVVWSTVLYFRLFPRKPKGAPKG